MVLFLYNKIAVTVWAVSCSSHLSAGIRMVGNVSQPEEGRYEEYRRMVEGRASDTISTPRCHHFSFVSSTAFCTRTMESTWLWYRHYLPCHYNATQTYEQTSSSFYRSLSLALTLQYQCKKHLWNLFISGLLLNKRQFLRPIFIQQDILTYFTWTSQFLFFIYVILYNFLSPITEITKSLA